MLGGFEAVHGKKSRYRFVVGIEGCKFVQIQRDDLLNVMRTSRTFQLIIQAECRRSNDHFEAMTQAAFKIYKRGSGESEAV